MKKKIDKIDWLIYGMILIAILEVIFNIPSTQLLIIFIIYTIIAFLILRKELKR